MTPGGAVGFMICQYTDLISGGEPTGDNAVVQVVSFNLTWLFDGRPLPAG